MRLASRSDGAAAPSSRPRLRQAGQFGIGRGQHDDVARRLAEIDRLIALVDRPFCAAADAWVTSAFQLTAARSLRSLPCRARQADDDQTAARGFRRQPVAVEIMFDAVAHRLHQQPHRPAGHLDETLQPQDVMLLDDRLQSADKSLGIG